MSVFKAVISYDGRFYNGFQKQPNKETVQGVLEARISHLLGVSTPIHGAGRTDAGVSARGQVISFKCDKELDLDKARTALNRLLPPDIFCVSLEKALDGFDARHSSKGKVYSYSFCYKGRDPLNAFETPLMVKDFDFGLFKKAMGIYVGKHDFKNFTTKKEDKDEFIRDVTLKEIFDRDGHVKVVLSSNGFMTYMVRILIGAACKVATKKRDIEWLKSSLEGEGRKIISFKSSPVVLVLEEVIYE